MGVPQDLMRNTYQAFREGGALSFQKRSDEAVETPVLYV